MMPCHTHEALAHAWQRTVISRSMQLPIGLCFREQILIPALENNDSLQQELLFHLCYEGAWYTIGKLRRAACLSTLHENANLHSKYWQNIFGFQETPESQKNVGLRFFFFHYGDNGKHRATATEFWQFSQLLLFRFFRQYNWSHMFCWSKFWHLFLCIVQDLSLEVKNCTEKTKFTE